MKTAMAQDGELQLMDTTRTIAVRPVVRMGGSGGEASGGAFTRG